jgi:hypothetical protein
LQKNWDGKCNAACTQPNLSHGERGSNPPKVWVQIKNSGLQGNPCMGVKVRTLHYITVCSTQTCIRRQPGIGDEPHKIKGFLTTTGSFTRPHLYQHRTQARLPATSTTSIPTWEGLNPPWLATSSTAVRGQDQDQLHKENKCWPHNLKATRGLLG